MITRQAIVDEARSWLGTRWHHQASLKGVGTDCIGLIGGVALALGMVGAREWKDDPSLHCYGRDPDPALLLGSCDKFLTRIPVHEATLADVLVMAFLKDPHHFALISRDNPRYLIHAYASVRKVVENGADVAGARVLRAYRFKDVA